MQKKRHRLPPGYVDKQQLRINSNSMESYFLHLKMFSENFASCVFADEIHFSCCL